MTIGIKRGTNISHWLSQSRARGEDRRKWFTRDDVQRIAGWGFDHIRLPVDEEQMWAEDGTRESEAFDLLNNALDWCAEAGINCIVDLHIIRSHHFLMKEEPALYTDPAEMARFTDLWRDLSAALNTRPVTTVAYELLNEAVAHDPERWNVVAHQAFDAIRALEPERKILMGSNQFCQVQTFPDLKIPDDDHAILTFHFYNPMAITHYKAGWMDLKAYTGPIQYPGQTIPDHAISELETVIENGRKYVEQFNRDEIMRQVRIAYDVAQQHDKPLYCGEFGVIFYTPDDIRARWYADIVSVFEELGIGWANWDYKGGFGLLQRDGITETGVHKILLGKG